MKPARLVASLLDHPHIRWQGHTRIHSLQPGSAPHTWLARSERGESFNAEQVVAARKLLVRSATDVRDAMARLEDAGCDELLLVPTSADPDEVDRIAEIVF